MVRKFRKVNNLFSSVKILLILGFLLLCFSRVSANITNDKFKTLLINNDIDEAIESYHTNGNQEWAYWIAKKFISNGDIESATEWYEESMKAGDQNSKFEIAEVLFHNKIDYSRSYNYFYELKNSNDKFLSSYAKYYLSIYHRYGINVPLNESMAYEYMNEASEEIELAKYSLIEYKLNGIGTKIDKKNAALMMFEFADQGYTEAEYDYAMMILNEMGIKKDEKIAIVWLERSAQKAYPPALQQLATMYYYGIGTIKNDTKAYEYYLLAKQLGVTDVELDMNMSTLTSELRKAAVDKFENFRPRMNDYSITYLRMPKFMK
ncbi:MAG: hypothetical protein CML88_05270 [Rhodobiaceae bacterium]|nr:hypothetical protein [Rhodobiaceae bacterium]